MAGTSGDAAVAAAAAAAAGGTGGTGGTGGEGDPAESGISTGELGPLSKPSAAAALVRPSAAAALVRTSAAAALVRPSAAAARRLAITLARPSRAGSITGDTALLMSTHSATCDETKRAQASASWRSGGCSQHQVTPQATPGSGQPRPISRLGGAGLAFDRAPATVRPCGEPYARELSEAIFSYRLGATWPRSEGKGRRLRPAGR